MGTVCVPSRDNLVYHATEYAGGIFRVRVGKAEPTPSTLERYGVLQLPDRVEPTVEY